MTSQIYVLYVLHIFLYTLMATLTLMSIDLIRFLVLFICVHRRHGAFFQERPGQILQKGVNMRLKWLFEGYKLQQHLYYSLCQIEVHVYFLDI